MKSGRRFVALILVFMLTMSMVVPQASADYVGFEDVPSTHWACKVITKWASGGYNVLMGDGKGKFYPDRGITLGELATILSKIFGYNERTEIEVTPNWADEFVEKAVAAGVIDKADKIDASIVLSREQAIKYIAIAYNVEPIEGNTTFLDDADIKTEYKPYVNAFQKLGYVVGNNSDPTKSMFNPQGIYTRAAAMQVIDNMTSEIIDNSVDGQIYDKSVIVRKSGVEISNTTVKGNLIIGQGVGDGAVTLNDVLIEGILIAYGGGSNSIVVKGDNAIKSTIVNKPFGEAVHLDGVFETITVANGTKVIITGKVNKLVILGNAEVTLDNAVIGSVEIIGDNVQLVLNSGSMVEDVAVLSNKVVISGNGKVNNVKATEKAKEGVEVLTVPTKITVDAKAGAVKTKYNGLVQPGTILITSFGSSSGGDGNNTPSTPKYSLVLVAGEGGKVTPTSGQHDAGDLINIQAIADTDYLFSHWSSSNGGIFADEYASITEFMMPENNVVLTANFVSIEADSDGDGISDYYEKLIGTDPENPDTDGDGLPDDYELATTKTDPNNMDTDNNGIYDSDEDFDGDGLTNIEEYRLGTRPNTADTDGDGLLDGDEVNTYGTNPLSVDTDEDGLTDWEEIQLGLDPTKAKSDDATPDSLRTFSQTLDSDSIDDELLNEENWLIPSVSGNVTGLISEHLMINKSSLDIFDDNRALVSAVIDVATDYTTPLTLTFTYSSSSYGGNIEDLAVFSYDGDDLVMLDTTVDESASTISAEIMGPGTYFVMDLNEFLKSIGIDVFKNISSSDSLVFAKAFGVGFGDSELADEPEFISIYDNYGNVVREILNPKYTIDDTDTNYDALVAAEPQFAPFIQASEGAMGKADIVFVIDKTGSMGSAINNVQSNINIFADKLVNEYNIDANFALIEFQDITYDGLDSTIIHKSGLSNWFTDVNKFKSEINSLRPDDGGDIPETPIDGLEMARLIDWRSNANKFVVLVTDAPYKNDNRYDIPNLTVLTDRFVADGIVVSVISYYGDDYVELYSRTGGLFGYIYGNFSETLIGLADKVGEVTNDGDWILLSGYQAVKLTGGKTGNDTDDDGLEDYRELTTKETKDLTSLIEALLAIHDVPMELYTGKTSVEVWSYRSRPDLPDTDFDGIDDKDDLYPKDNRFEGKITRLTKKGKAEYAEDKGRISFDVDYRWFFNDNRSYNSGISVLSSLYAADIYEPHGDNKGDVYIELTKGANLTGQNPPTKLLSTFGLKDPKVIKIGYSDNDRTEIAIGHHYVEYKGQKKEIILVAIRGTNGTFEEWSSNFDVGADTIEYWDRNNPYWLTKTNHKGFDVTANRVIEAVDDYVNTTSSINSVANKVYWVTGHSRGAGIANIVGAYLEKRGETSFTYTFAAPRTTTASSVSNYKSIFNIVNTDDLITELPLEKWGFKRYGVDRKISVAEFSEGKTIFGTYKGGAFKEMIGMNYDNNGKVDWLLGIFEDIADKREDLYHYTYADDTIQLSSINRLNKSNAEKDSDNQKAKTPPTLQRYCKFVVFEGTNLFGIKVYRAGMYQTPAYFMQTLADLAATQAIHAVADKYEEARNAFVITFLSGMEHPHWPETYYLIAKGKFSNAW